MSYPCNKAAFPTSGSYLKKIQLHKPFLKQQFKHSSDLICSWWWNLKEQYSILLQKYSEVSGGNKYTI